MANNKESDFMKNPELKWFMSEELSDFAFVVEGQRVPVLKALLSVKSDVFHKMFTDGFKESTANEIAIEGTTFEAFKTFVRFIYTDELVLDTADYKMVGDVCALADRYQVMKLIDRVGHRYKSRISMANLGSLYPIAVRFRIEDLIEALNSWIAKNFEQWYTKDPMELTRLDIASNGALFACLIQNFQRFMSKEGSIPCISKTHRYSIEREFLKQFKHF